MAYIFRHWRLETSWALLLFAAVVSSFIAQSFHLLGHLYNTPLGAKLDLRRSTHQSSPTRSSPTVCWATRSSPTSRAAQLAELSTTAEYSWKLSISAYLQNFATKNAVFTHFRDKNDVVKHFCVKNLWFHRYVTICLTRASFFFIGHLVVGHQGLPHTILIRSD